MKPSVTKEPIKVTIVIGSLEAAMNAERIAKGLEPIDYPDLPEQPKSY